MYLSQENSYQSCSNPCYSAPVNYCPPVMNQCPNICPPSVVYQPYYIPQQVILPHVEYVNPINSVINQQSILPPPQLQYNWTPANVYNMRWPIRGNINQF